MIQVITEGRYILWCNGCGRQAGGEYIKVPFLLPLGWSEGELHRHYCPTCAIKILKEKDKKKTIEEETREKPTELERERSKWKKSSEMIPGRKIQWVLGRSETGKIYIVRWSRSLEIWVGADNKELSEKITHWIEIPSFP